MTPDPNTVPVYANIYWAHLNGDKGIKAMFQSWKPLICSFTPYGPPVDPLHCTLLYDRNDDIIYQEHFEKELANQNWILNSTQIYIGDQGVSAFCALTTEQLTWYEMCDTSIPHISLALAPGHEAKELGPMTKRLHETTDWELSEIPNLLYSPSQKAYRIDCNVYDDSILENLLIPRYHGCEATDHDLAETYLKQVSDRYYSI